MSSRADVQLPCKNENEVWLWTPNNPHLARCVKAAGMWTLVSPSANIHHGPVLLVLRLPKLQIPLFTTYPTLVRFF